MGVSGGGRGRPEAAAGAIRQKKYVMYLLAIFLAHKTRRTGDTPNGGGGTLLK